MRRTTNDSSEVLNFAMQGKSDWKLHDKADNKATIKLNPNPMWDINIEMGAGTAKLNLTPFKIRNLHIKGGAASFKVKLGKPGQRTNVSVETGVSEIEVSVPAAAACKINVESGLSSKDFKGFIKNDDGSFSTENYEGAPNPIVLNLKGGLSEFKVNRY